MNGRVKVGDLIRSKIKEHSLQKSNLAQQNSAVSSSLPNQINYSYSQSIKLQTSKIINSQSVINKQPIQSQQKTHNSQCLDTKSLTDQVKASISANRIRQFSSARNLELDPRDQRILIPFQSLYYNLLEQSNFFISFQPFKDQILDWLIDIIEIVASISFNHLKKQTLTEVEVKAFAAKNILLNVKELYEKYPKIPLQKRVQLMAFINESAQSILQKIIHKYPQNSSRGASKRVKSRITNINNRQSDEFDFLLQNNINITYREDGDYSESIMKIINKLVSYTNQVFDSNDEFQETNFEVFTEIMEYIFQNCNSQSVSNISQQIAGVINRKKNPDQSYLSQLNGAFAQHLMSWGEAIREEQSKKNSSFIKDSHKTFLIGHKIPSGTRLFSQEDINGSIFKIHDSSILRLLTKWAEELKQKLANPQESIYRRLYKFKNCNGKLINLQVDLKNLLYEAAIEQYKKINEYFDMLKSENIYLQTLFAEELNKSKYSKNDIKIDVFAAKINKISGHYMFRYINKMIHSLLTISKLASEKAENQHDRLLLESVNLITFKIGDLMRSKCACSEQQFIKILSVIDQINQRYPDFLKIVRIKNRLEMQNNDILINLFFMNKVQCELQLSITGKSDKNQKKSNQFCHFIYQIIRSQMGPISQLSITLAQYDPMINVLCKEESFSAEIFSQQTIQQKKRLYGDKIQQRVKVRRMLNLQFNIELPFICFDCQKLSIVYNPNFLWRNPNSRKKQCNDCRLQQINKIQAVSKVQQPMKDHLINNNFTKQQDKIFFTNHFCFWDPTPFIKKLYELPQNQVITQMIPQRGFMIKANQKIPKLQFFTSLYETVSQYVKFANKGQNGRIKLLSKIPVNRDKKRRIQIFKTELVKYYIFKLINTQQIVQDGYLYFKCSKQDCCGLSVKAGVNLSFEEMIIFTHNLIIQSFIDNRKNAFYLHGIPQSFNKLQQQLAKYEQGPKFKIISNRIQAIQAYSCSLDNINLVKTFGNLFQLNISSNPQLKSLKGLENCVLLRFLNCKQCDISNLDELSNLFKLQYLNVGLNKNLRCLKGLEKHSQLIELYMECSQVTLLDALSQCSKLQTLDIQSCTFVKSLEPIKSLKLTYLNIIDCVGLQKFNLPIQSMKSLKTINVIRRSVLGRSLPQFMAFNLIYSSLKMIDKSDATFEETIQKINSILQMKKTGSTSLMII